MTMSNEQTSPLVFKDHAGEYYLLPQAALEQGRVPEEHKAEVERLLAEGTQGDDGEDVQGFSYVRIYVLFGSNIGFGTPVTTDTGTLNPGLRR